NLNDLSANYSKKEEDKVDFISGDSKNDFTQQRMLELWNQYAEKRKNDGKINIFTLMTTHAPSLLESFVIEVTVENKIQEELLLHEKIDLLNFLRVKLENFSTSISTKQVEQTNKKRLYTSGEKYDHMVEKNPNLEELRRRFNLNID
ncbi:MAG: DNA polymerase III subunit gamma/tau, partial [Daejeonella sp.]